MDEKKAIPNHLKTSKGIESDSKSRCNKKHMFNKATANKTLSSPANDRLKRLQTELQKAKPVSSKKDEKKTDNSKTKKNPPKLRKAGITSSLAYASPKDRLKILQGKAVIEQLNHKTEECLEVNLPVKIDHQKSVKVEKAINNNATYRSVPYSIKTREAEVVKEETSSKLEQKNVKALAKTPRSFSVSKDSKNVCSETNTFAISSIENIKTDSKNTAKKRLSQHFNSETPVKSVKTENPLKFLTETPNATILTVKCPKFNANTRLERFRKSLQNENNIVNNNFHSIKDSKFVFEPMDWEPTDEPNQSSLGLDFPVNLNKGIYEEPEDMDVDENLMLVAAREKQKIEKFDEKWQKNRIYIVLDTNVFIKNLSFIDKIKSKEISDELEIILYIPYSVLQELDKLKVRESIKGPVVKAIRYLNKVFEEKIKIIQVQNAFEECTHLIDIDSPDDKILNCCFQVKAHIPNVILLTEDVNLRNKAMCNNIEVSTISELLDKKLRFIASKVSS